MPEESIVFGVGSVITIIGAAMGYGSLRTTVKQLTKDLQDEVYARVVTDAEVRELLIWKARQEGKSDARKHYRKHSIDTTQSIRTDES